MIEHALKPLPVIEGRGGKSGGEFHEDPNTLRSRGIARILDLISEGEIRGLVDGEKSIILDDTPVQNADGSRNFEGVSWAIVHGLPDQPYLPGFTSVMQPVATFSSIDLHQNVSNVRRISDLDANAAIVTINLPALNYADEEGTRLTGSSVTHEIHVTSKADQPDATTALAVRHTISGKCMSPYEEDYRVYLPEGQGPWDIKVIRTTADSQDVHLVNASQWSRLQTVFDHKFSYPYSAIVGLEVNSEYFGTTIPRRAYEIYGLIIQVPSNYDPLTRTYTGLWDGTFKWAWTNNPAWVFYDLCTNERYGAGINPKYVDKWSLYQIAQYCDAVEDDGAGNMTFVGVPDGYGGMEPRFTYNGVLNKSEQTYKVLTSLASSFRGMVYWGAGLVTATQDSPSDTTKIFTPANVINGDFEYSGSSKKARHTVAIVGWNNPALGYEIDYEVVEDHDGILRFGMRPTDVQAFGCTSRGQARRVGRWLLATEALETDSVKFKTGFEGSDLAPGHMILVADPSYAGVRMGGRILEVETQQLRIDAVFDFKEGEEYEISMLTESGVVVTLGVGNAPGQSDIVELTTALPGDELPIVGAIFALSEIGNVEPRPFRVISVAESEGHQYEVFALEHQPSKYAIADEDAAFDDDPDNKFQRLPTTSRCLPPTNLTSQVQTVVKGYGTMTVLQVSWEASTDPIVSGYMLSYRVGADNWVQLPLQSATTFTINDPFLDIYEFRVYAINKFGIPSGIVTNSIDLRELGAAGALDLVFNLDTALGLGDFEGRDVTWAWLAAPVSNPALTPSNTAFRDDYFDGFRVRIYDMVGNIIREEVVHQPTYTYTYDLNLADGGPHRQFQVRVSLAAKDGSHSHEAVLTTQNPAPNMAAVTADITPYAVTFRYAQPYDSDFGGIKIWMDTAPFVADDDTNLVFKGLGTPNVTVSPNTTYYWQYEFYDAFGPSGTKSQQFSFNTGAVPNDWLDTDPPASMDVGPTLGSTLTIDPAGNPTVELAASWNTGTETDIVGYDVELTLGTGTAANPVWGEPTIYSTGDNRYQWNGLQPNILARARARAYDKVNNKAPWSPYSATHVLAKDTGAPGVATSFTATAGVNAIYLGWTNPSNSDLASVEVWTNTTNNSSTASRIASVNALPSKRGGFAYSGLSTGTTFYFWLKTVDTSGNVSGFSAVASAAPAQLPAGDISGQITGTQITDDAITTPKVAANAITGNEIAGNSITSNHIVAGTIVAADIMAGSLTGDRFSTTTSLPGTITVGTTGVSIETVRTDAATGAQDPATRINANSTKIDPGKITISGSTTLANWRSGTDATLIEGGKIAANTILANSLQIGNRGVDISGLEFEAQKTVSNRLTWTAGTISYVDDDGTAKTAAITSSYVTWSAGTGYVYWTKGQTVLRWTTSIATAYAANNIVLATYNGGYDLVVTYGRTIINGTQITTGSIAADRLNVTSLSAISANIGLLRTATSGARTEIENNQIRVYDSNSVLRVRMGVW